MCFQALALSLIHGLSLFTDVLKVVGAVMQVGLATYDGGRRSEATTASAALTVPVTAVPRLFAPEEARGHGAGGG